MRWESAQAERNSLQAEKVALRQKGREQAEEMVLTQGSVALEDMEEAGAAALEGDGVGESRTKGGNDS